MLLLESRLRSCLFVMGVALAAMATVHVPIASSQEPKPSTGLESPAQSDAESAPTRLEYRSPETQRWQAGVKVQTHGSSCQHVYATFPIPTNWPEQQVTLAEKDLSRYVQSWEVRTLVGGVKQVVLQMANIPPATLAEALFTFEVTKSRIGGEYATDDLQIPKSVERDQRVYLGSSPYIDPRHVKIRKIVAQLETDPSAKPWERVQTIYDWVRDNIQYQEGEIKTAIKALDDGFGDCEELTSLFVALCRANRIPARMVWVPGHCYPEFMLQDAQGDDFWFPCQVAGTRQFGEMDEYKPILQKGDRFVVPEKKTPQRYVAEYCTIKARSQPEVTFVRQMDSAPNE